MTTNCLTYLIIFLKLWSYVQTNYWCRAAKKAKALKSSLRRQSLSAPNWSKFFHAILTYGPMYLCKCPWSCSLKRGIISCE